MLTSVELEHFKNIGSQKVSLTPLNVLVGRNGAGKSNFIDALRFLRDAITYGLESAIMWRGGLQSIRQWTASADRAVAIGVAGRDEAGSWRYRLELTQRGTDWSVGREVFEVGDDGKASLQSLLEIECGQWLKRPMDVDPQLGGNNLVFPLLAGQSPYREAFVKLADMQFYSIFAGMLPDVPARYKGWNLDEGGPVLSSILLQLQDRAPNRFEELKHYVCRIAENIDDIRILSTERSPIVQFHHPDPSPHWEAAAAQSDGTLRALGLLAARYQTPEPSLIAFEEPELNLHPGAMGLLADTFVEASLNTQIILTTHSPDLISRFPTESLLVVESVDGEAHIGPIDDTQREVVEEGLFTTGDLLRIEGGLERRTVEDGTK